MEQQIIRILTELRPEFDFNQNINFIEEGMLVDIVPENFSSVEAIKNLLLKNGAK